jgi:hypothetical protein
VSDRPSRCQRSADRRNNIKAKDSDNKPTAADPAVPVDELSANDFATMRELFAEDRDITCPALRSGNGVRDAAGHSG